jgi:hypothetical protein
MTKEELIKLENKIDSYLFDILDSSIPRNKYIYHCNLVFIDIVLDQKLLFTVSEKDYLFSLSYNTFIAHKKLQEEIEFDFKFDRALYVYAFKMILLGMQYSLLCNVFPLIHSGKAKIEVDEFGVLAFEIKNIPRKNYKYISDYTIRKALSYTLQMANGKLSELEDEQIAMKLSEMYMNFWNENMLFQDFEPYTRLDWGGISFFFILAAMRRFNKIYKNDFDIVTTDSQKMMIILSKKGVEQLRGYVLNSDNDLYKMTLEDNIYKPLGKKLYPKLSVSDAPLNKTIDGFIFANPLVILFNDSNETRFLNYLRKHDNKRYLRIKDKIKERAIPIITEMIHYKFPEACVIPNFNILIPGSNKNHRECDMLIVDQNGYAIYIEIKHFYYPISCSETNNLDEQLSLALDKIPEQLLAIEKNWDILKQNYQITTDLKILKGVIVSHHFTGYDVRIDANIPIVSVNTLYESIAEAQSIEEIFNGCKEIDTIYPNIKFVSRDINFLFAGIAFRTKLECLDPAFEVQFIRSYRKMVSKNLVVGRQPQFDNVSDLAKAYIEAMKKS